MTKQSAAERPAWGGAGVEPEIPREIDPRLMSKLPDRAAVWPSWTGASHRVNGASHRASHKSGASHRASHKSES